MALSGLQQFQETLAERLREATQAPADSRLAFESGSLAYLARLGDTSEVLPLPELTPVPLTRTWMLGLANVRGRLVSVVDFSAFLGEPATVITPQARLVVLAERFGSHAGLLVARVLGLRSIEALQKREDWAAGEWLGGLYRQTGGADLRELDLGALASSERFLQAGI